ncbi:MAG TPA: sensor domain-containing protein, partial [Mycobacterium sp.]|uniref:sensor domain-containing protein n=1 Tax=Mycobacterium sp. TaxID=1785 RepID=UPI002D4B3BE7
AIDFGSSNTAAAFRDRHGYVQELRLSAAGSLMPSAVFYDGSRFLVGRTALQAAFTSPEAFEPSPKRRLADREVFLAGSMIAVTEMVAAVFAEVLARASQVMAAAPDVVVVTHPDQWSAPLQQLLAESACAGGVDRNRLRLVSEAQAAAWFYAMSAPDMAVGARLVVFDFGAGTCDVAVLERQPDHSFAVIASDGLDGLGGHDLDARIQAWVRRQLAASDPVLLAEVNDSAAIATRLALNDRIRDAKEALSEASSAAIVVAATADTQVLQLTRDEFDELIGPDIDRAVGLTKRVMAEAHQRRPSDQTPTIYLTGGSSQIPLVHSRLAKLAPVGVLGDPKMVVAQGALYTPEAAPAAPPQPPSVTSVSATAPTPAATTATLVGPPPTHTQQPPHVKVARRSRWWALAGRGLVGIIFAAVLALFAWGVSEKQSTPARSPARPPTPAGPLVAPAKLASLLLSSGQINGLMNSITMQGPGISNHLTATSDQVANHECLGSLYGSQPSVYAGSGYIAVSDQFLTGSSANNMQASLEQTAVGFPSADAARAFFTTLLDGWQACVGHVVPITSRNADGTSATSSWTIQEVKTVDTAISQILTTAGAGFSCQHGLQAVHNVVVDVTACGHSITNQGADIAAAIAAKATTGN